MPPVKARPIADDDTCKVRHVHRDRISRAREEAIAGRELGRLALIFRILGDPTRLKIVMALQGGEMCVCDLAAFLGLSESAISHQLRRLKDLHMITQRREGQILYCSLNDDHVSRLVKIGLEHVCE